MNDSILNWFKNIFITDIDYTIQVSELAYYWIISIALLIIAWKTYKNSFKKEVVLMTQLSYYDDFLSDNLYLEIYNNGNDVARNIVLSCYNDNLIDANNSILNNDLGFIKPNTSKKIHIGYSFRGNLSILGKEVSKEDFLSQEIKINIRYNKSESKDFILNTSFLSSLSSVYLSKENPAKETSKSLKEISKTLNGIKKEMSKTIS